MILAIDPGKEKYGFALLAENQRIEQSGVIRHDQVIDQVKCLIKTYNPSVIVVGQGYFGSKFGQELAKQALAVKIVYQSEKYTTEQARARYWLDHPPRGLLKLIPTSFRFPPVPVDNYAAIILGERYLAQN